MEENGDIVEGNVGSGGEPSGGKPGGGETAGESAAGALGPGDGIGGDASVGTSEQQAAVEAKATRRRQEKVGLVTSDKMQKTVVVRVERQVRHRKYRRYVRRRSKFMAHDELGSHVGDTVRIVETRPMSARKRWRVVEILQKAR
ncbi:MAG TPA: 30S ribosomal protein S17 [Blastocatellia bacterium]|nr:30S ribosomal protein S17 [Blastocatellia bacterium]